MPKGKSKPYTQKYCKSWESDEILKPWLKPVAGDETKAQCKFCKCILRAHHTDLIKHASAQRHLTNAAPFSAARTLEDFGCRVQAVNNSTKIADLLLAVFVACHTAIAAVDHLGNITKTISGKNVTMARTKCSAIIKNVLRTVFCEQLYNDLKDVPFSLIIDESTDIGDTKQLCVVVRYYCKRTCSITTTFLAMLTLTDGTADAIFDAIMVFLRTNNIPIANCVGLATDGCSVMVGAHNSVITRFKAVCPGLIHIRCICHSIQLCSSYAAKTLPRGLEFLISDTHSWFSHSTKRKETYKILYESLHVGEEPLKIMRVCDTRWLSIAPCVQRILSQFDVLTKHFETAGERERCYATDKLHQLYTSPDNRIYLEFLNPWLDDLNKVNKMFQADQASPVKLLQRLMTLYCSILQTIMIPATFTTWASILEFDIDNPRHLLPTAAVHFGVAFNLAVAKTTLDNAAINYMKERCRTYLFVLLKEMRNRIPTNVQQLESLSDLSPSVVLGRNKPRLQSLSFLPLYKGNLGKLEQQWNCLSLYQWQHRDDVDVEAFWVDVAHHTDATGEHDFHELGMFVLSLLALPFSNAAVERSFSQMNIIKSKQRNRMQQKMLEAIMHVRGYMRRNKMCCDTFKPTDDMLARHNASMYHDVDDTSLPDDVSDDF